MFLSANLRHSTFIGMLALAACSDSPPLPPHCRVIEELPEISTVAAGCIVTSNNQLLVIRHRLSGKLDIPAGGVNEVETSACAAHRETFEETGINTLVNAHLSITQSGLALFSCVQQSGFDADKYAKIPVPEWSTTEVEEIQWVDPFELSHQDLRYPDQLAEIRDAFVKAARQQK